MIFTRLTSAVRQSANPHLQTLPRARSSGLKWGAFQARANALVSPRSDKVDWRFANGARSFVTGNSTMLEINQRAEIGAEDVVTAAIAALENALGPTPTRLDFQTTVFVGQKPTT
jgi:hypothetical protein